MFVALGKTEGSEAGGMISLAPLASPPHQICCWPFSFLSLFFFFFTCVGTQVVVRKFERMNESCVSVNRFLTE